MVIDASAAVEMLLDTAPGRRLSSRLAADSVEIHVPHVVDLEIAHALRRYVRQGAFDAARGTRALRRWRHLRAERYEHRRFLDRIWELRHNVSAYDAVYVALAEALSTSLLTADRRLAGAPGLEGRIELI
ncbi:MAG: type II toxin-antitoxin system VapC family toxin [Acidobacteria bacterium]|nr:type II toxin-antitoxin system VapC family toxin [Acidobacteriota bacterium]